jgi:hypothetical protein
MNDETNTIRSSSLGDFRRAAFAAWAAALAFWPPMSFAAVPEVRLASGGRALHTVVVGENAAAEVRQSATELAEYLGRITGAEFSLQTGDGSAGIVVGLPTDFGRLPFQTDFGTGPLDREDYLLRSTGGGLYILGASPLGVSNGVWDLLHRLGYRYFFPTETWEYIPERPELTVALDVRETPSHYSRGIWWTTEDWQRRNRNLSGFSLSTSHVYGSIIRRNQEAFDKNPEFLALRNGDRGGSKFCISNAGLRKLVVEDAIRQMTAEPALDSLSMEPSDGGGWCECQPCAEMGSISDRVVLLANDVAEAINGLGLGDKHVGILAYASHSPPPSLPVHPRVIVNLATGFIRGGHTIDSMLDGWGKQTTLFGIREYYYSYANLPGGGNVSDITYLARTIPEFHARGARFLNANTHGAWGPTGFSHYLIARLLWDIDQAGCIEETFHDFLDKSFGPAREPMRAYYRLMHRFEDTQTRPMLSSDLLGRMYRLLAEARGLTDDARILTRLDDLILYTRHAELYHQTANAAGSRRQEIYDQWVQHSYRMADRKMVHTSRMGGSHYAPGGVTDVDSRPETKREMQQAARPYTRAEIDAFVSEGIAANALLDFQPVDFSDDLVPAAASLNLSDVPEGSYGSRGLHSGSREFLVWVERPGEIRLRVLGGVNYQDRGNVRLALRSPRDELGEPVDTDESVPPDQQEHDVVLSTPHTGLHTLQATNGGARFQVHFPAGMPVSLKSDYTPSVGFTLYFYVPRGTSVVGGYVDSGEGGLFDGDGRQVYSFEDGVSRGYFRVAVPEGQDGHLWRARTWRGRGQLRLMTVPPYLALDGKRLMLPREVVERDR